TTNRATPGLPPLPAKASPPRARTPGPSGTAADDAVARGATARVFARPGRSQYAGFRSRSSLWRLAGRGPVVMSRCAMRKETKTKCPFAERKATMPGGWCLSNHAEPLAQDPLGGQAEHDGCVEQGGVPELFTILQRLRHLAHGDRVVQLVDLDQIEDPALRDP